MSKEKKIQKCKEEHKENLMHLIKFFAYKEGVLKKEKQLKAIWGYLSPRIEYLKDIPKKFLIKVFLQYLIQKNLKKNLIKIQRIH